MYTMFSQNFKNWYDGIERKNMWYSGSKQYKAYTNKYDPEVVYEVPDPAIKAEWNKPLDSSSIVF